MADEKPMSLQKPVPSDGVLIGSPSEPTAEAPAPVAAAEVEAIGRISVVETPAVPAAPDHPTKAMQTRSTILTGPVLPTLLRLALPTMTVLLAQTAVHVAEAYYVGYLGTHALAGVALVFPVFMLIAMMSNRGVGADEAPGAARATVSHRQDRAY